MYFVILQPEDMSKLCLNFNESQLICAYKRYSYKKECVSSKLCFKKQTPELWLSLFFKVELPTNGLQDIPFFVLYL